MIISVFGLPAGFSAADYKIGLPNVFGDLGLRVRRYLWQNQVPDGSVRLLNKLRTLRDSFRVMTIKVNPGRQEWPCS